MDENINNNIEENPDNNIPKEEQHTQNNQYDVNQFNGGYNNYGQNNINNNGNNDKFATASFVLGIVALSISVICNCCAAFVPTILGILGLVFGISSINTSGKSMYAKLGIIFSAVAIGLSILFIILSIVLSISTNFIEYMKYYTWT